MSAHMFSPPPRPSIMRRGITRAFDDVIARGMAKKPDGQVRVRRRTGQGGERRRGRRRSRRVRPSRAEPAVEHEAVLGGLRESGRDGLHARTRRTPPHPSRRRAKSRFGPTQVALAAATIVLFGVAVVLAATVGLRRPQQQPFASDHAGCAAPEHDDRDDCAIDSS